MLLLFATSLLAFSPPTTRTTTPAVRTAAPASQLSFKPQPAAISTAAALFAASPLPAMADEGGGIGDVIVNGVLSVFVLGFIGFIGKFALEAFGEIGDIGAETAEYINEKGQRMKEAKKNMDDAAVFDDSGSGAVSAAQIKAEIESREKNGRGSFQTGANGQVFAPWIDIDEKRVAEVKAERAKRKKR